jgi:hypothetical protein
VPARTWSLLGNWRAFADGIAVLLGLNVWFSIILLPGLYVGVWGDSRLVITSLLALAMLLVGVWRRNDLALLLGFPAALMLPVALHPEIASPAVYGTARLVVVGIGVLVYLFGASFFTSFYEPPAPASVRSLSSARQPTPERWKRRFRVYRALAVLSLSFPLVLFYSANLHGPHVAALRRQYPGRIVAMNVLVDLLIIAVWLVLYIWVFLGVLRPHRTGDRDLVTRLALMKAEAQRRRPRPIFFVAVATALGLMLLLLYARFG